jgi:hypothetical protein
MGLGGAAVRTLGVRSGEVGEAAERTLELEHFAFLDAFAYVLSFAASLATVLFILSIIFVAAGFAVVNPLCRQLLLAYVVYPWLGGLVARWLLRRAYRCCVADGQRLLMPRYFLWLDLTLSFTLSALTASASGITRTVMGMVVGLLASAQLSHSVLPAAFATADGGYQVRRCLLQAPPPSCARARHPQPPHPSLFDRHTAQCSSAPWHGPSTQPTCPPKERSPAARRAAASPCCCLTVLPHSHPITGQPLNPCPRVSGYR